MAYSIQISFRTAKTIVSVFETISETNDMRLKDIGQILMNIRHELPSIRDVLERPYQRPKSLNRKYGMDLQVMMNVFSTTFIYWAEYGILGMVGDEDALGSTAYETFPVHLSFSSAKPVPQPKADYAGIPMLRTLSDNVVPYPRYTTTKERDEELGRINTAVSTMLKIPELMDEQHIPEIFTLRTTLMSDPESTQRIKDAYFEVYKDIRLQAQKDEKT